MRQPTFLTRLDIGSDTSLNSHSAVVRAVFYAPGAACKRCDNLAEYLLVVEGCDSLVVVGSRCAVLGYGLDERLVDRHMNHLRSIQVWGGERAIAQRIPAHVHHAARILALAHQLRPDIGFFDSLWRTIKVGRDPTPARQAATQRQFQFTTKVLASDAPLREFNSRRTQHK